MTLLDLIQQSGDSYLENYRYENGQVSLWIDLDELDKKILLRVQSRLMALDIPADRGPTYRTCFLELTRLTDFLETKNGIYIPSKEFGQMMQEKRQNLNLAYGLREKDAEFVFSLSANVKLASFVIKSIESVEFEFLDSPE